MIFYYYSLHGKFSGGVTSGKLHLVLEIKGTETASEKKMKSKLQVTTISKTVNEPNPPATPKKFAYFRRGLHRSFVVTVLAEPNPFDCGSYLTNQY